MTDDVWVEKSTVAPPTFRFAYETTDSFRKESLVKRQGRGAMHDAYNWKTRVLVFYSTAGHLILGALGPRAE